MTNWTKELKKYEMAVWENGSTWQRARIAHRHHRISEMTTEELNELRETVEEMNFYAEMSDSWKVTCSEKAENNAIAEAARVELIARRCPRFTIC